MPGFAPAAVNNVGRAKGNAAISNPEDEERRLFVGGLSWSTNEKILNDYFIKFGPIEDSIIKRNEVGNPRGFAFVLYKDVSSIDKVLRAGPHEIDGRNVNPKRVRPQELLRGPSRKLYVRNSKDASENQLRDYFSKFGLIANMDLPMHHNSDGSKVRKEFCFIEFELAESADAACEKGFHTIGSCAVEVRKFVNRDPGPKPQRGGMTPHGATPGARFTVPGRGDSYHPYGGPGGYAPTQPTQPGPYGSQWLAAGAAAPGAQPYYNPAAYPSSYYASYYQNYGAVPASGAAAGYSSTGYGVSAPGGVPGYGASPYGVTAPGAATSYTSAPGAYGASTGTAGYYGR